MVDNDNNNITKNNNNDNDGPNAGLIAGLTTGLVVAALVALTAGLFIYRKRKRARMNISKKTLDSVEDPPPSNPMVSVSPPSPLTILVPPQQTHQQQDQHHYETLPPLYIPPLSTTPAVNNSIGLPTTTIQRSLTLASRPHRKSPTAISSNSPLNRSASVKITKYDHYPLTLDDDDLDHVQIRRAISVKRQNANTSSTTVPFLVQPVATTVSRSNSVRSTNNRGLDDKESITAITTTSINKTTSIDSTTENNNKLNDGSMQETTTTTTSSAGSGAIQVVCAKPTIARIRSISRKGTKGKKSTIEQEDKHEERTSIPGSTHSSTLADGEITVYWQPPSTN
ncbi:uncharacterized protein BX664DRAFT_339557 [Halteromyces radiatus]|uniref:uncharacterized protein n=1 Tax=Halteromyces radiatus TaxID=101107 RepID=UPI00221E8FF4|nr:uncharacterized protein BX664DRAFT_339557 [Halteromyces radiatus]KAI8082983.1 hypothetical protein BX664DRAFT_339557 [Halteromyces radiatus]